MSAYVPASHIYTGSAQCGCVVAMCVDQPEYAHDIDEFRNLGYVVTRIETAKQAWTRCEAHKDLNDEAWLVAVDAVLHAARTGRPCFEDAALMSAELAAALATVDALRAERDELRSRVDAADAERDEVLKVADVATDAAAKAVLDAKEVYEVRHLETIRRLKALLAEARPMVYMKANEFSEHEDVTLERQSVLARIDKEIAS